MNVPSVSVGLPVWNGEKFIRSALDSILQQEFADFELIISDNSSTDATENICREYAAKDPRVRYSRNEKNIGATGNYNRVFELARGEFFKWISHDDECAPSFLRRCMETFEKASPDTVLVCSRNQKIDETGRVVHVSGFQMTPSPSPSRRLASLIGRRDFPHPIWGLIRSKALRQTRLMGVVRADEVLLAELALLGRFVEIPEELQRWRVHPQNAMKVHRTSRQLVLWHDPSKANRRFILPDGLAWDLEYFRAIRHIPNSGMERLFCYAVISSFALMRRARNFRNMLRLRTRLKTLFPQLVRQSI